MLFHRRVHLGEIRASQRRHQSCIYRVTCLLSFGCQFPPRVVCIRFSQPGGCISDKRSSEPARSHRRTRVANSLTSASVLPTP